MFGNKTHLLLVLFIIAVLDCEGVTVSKQHFSLLGQISKIVAITEDGKNNTLQTSYYLLSQNAAGWSTSASDCKAFIHENATLVNIETEEELLKFGTIFKNSDDTGSSYWTGGKYDVEKKKYVWGDGTEIRSEFWDKGHPLFDVPVGRVLVDGVSVKLQTTFNTQSSRFICEYTELTEEICECQ